jgi:hypothetical protein
MSRAGLRCPVVEDFPLAVLEPAGVPGRATTPVLRQALAKVLTARPDVELGRYYVIVAVRDGRPTLPRLRTPDPETGGHGLLIVEGLCASWGSAPTVTGKIVWGTLRRPGAGLRPAAAARRR